IHRLFRPAPEGPGDQIIKPNELAHQPSTERGEGVTCELGGGNRGYIQGEGREGIILTLLYKSGDLL
ncbi:MAG: hypothetical protein ACUVQU_07380, partial [Candidatus Bipolaricaulia bacterium]